jgi:hypothetical protein
MLGRIDAVVPAGEHRDRSGRKRRTVRRRVDAAREARDHGEAGLAELARDPLGEFHAGAGGVARTDDGDHRQRERRRQAADRHEWRRIVDHLQPRRVAGFAQGHERDAKLFRRGDLALRVGARADLRRAAGAAAPRQ